ncbi:SDR family NAD(P)-dependent oxidoreductase [Anaerobacillus sp. CMMVII]|uniref:SDR family NAD(P)-dependent oxidoreductase n=1 Tax=Anaerobacillus sp. CMMVII TaxID=2755588 RepID=UPI0021B73207|nr:SDR family NAD(P)-dependent oxidoreductase [Anaerobacillus sp. CMMVII]MCT8139171.1 SDR family NAD(P)-dependent oxidoreductase [Anaerobacillus sp. CMMVII]
MNILITGASGFLGSTLAKQLLEDKHNVYLLVRNNKKLNNFININQDHKQRITILEGELTEAELGLNSKMLNSLVGKIDVVYHTAAFLSFDEGKREQIFQVNVNGTRNVLEVAEKIGVNKFVHVSTAYTLGVQENGLEQLYPIDGTFTNDYEESKCKAEHLVMSYQDKFAVTIMRPAIIIGDSKTGEASTTFGLYGILRAIELLKKKV